MEHFDWKMGFWAPYTNFIIFLSLAVYFLRKPLIAMAQKRRNDYLAAFKSATEAKELAEAKLAELDKRLSGLDQEMELIKSQSIADAKRESDKILAAANQLANHLKQEASRIAEAEVNKARTKLRTEILEQVQKNVQTKIKSEFTEEKQHSYIEKHASNINQLSLRI